MLRWRLFGIDFCIQPTFWMMSALFGFLAVNGLASYMIHTEQLPQGEYGMFLLKYIGIWVLCTLVSVMTHELGHAVTGRIFGVPGNITLAGMGGQAVGNFDMLHSWKRVLVIMAGPGAGFLLLFALTLLNRRPWNDFVTGNDPFFGTIDLPGLKVPWAWDLFDQFGYNALKSERPYKQTMMFLVWMNLIWNLINLIPIMPLDGGMLMKEPFTLMHPVWGLRTAFAISFLLAGALTVYSILSLTIKPDLYMPIHPFFGILMFAQLAIQNLMMMFQVKSEMEPQAVRPRRTPYHDPD